MSQMYKIRLTNGSHRVKAGVKVDGVELDGRGVATRGQIIETDEPLHEKHPEKFSLHVQSPVQVSSGNSNPPSGGGKSNEPFPYDAMTKDALMELALETNLKVDRNMKKDEIIAVLRASD